MKKIIIAILVIIAFSCILSYCGSIEGNENTKPNTTVAETTINKQSGPVRDGEYVYFGNYYEHTGHPDDIEWKILKEEDGKLLVISTDYLDYQPYNTENANVTWETCSLRAWLNEDFINDVFSPSEQKYILTTTVSNPDNPDYGTEGGNDTEDKIFLLSIDEVNMFFPDEKARHRDSNWWLRSPGSSSNGAASIAKDGWATSGGYIYHDWRVDSVFGVRPVMWIKLKT